MEQKELQSIWDKVLENFRNADKITESECQRWLIPIVPLSLDDNSFSLGVANDFSLHYIKDHYIPFIKDAVFTITGKKVDIDITTTQKESDSEKEENDDKKYEVNTSQTSLFVADKSLSEESGSDSNSHFAPVMPGDHSSLKEKYTFENFVRGNSNQMAHASALAVAELTVSKSPQLERYNPLFLYSGVGLGKTHLMHAIGNYILEKNPSMRVLYISSERFLNDFIASIREGKPEEFQRKYRSIDVLLVDDVQFLYTKERTQEEFFHTFNALHSSGKQIVISSDKPPKKMETLDERFRSRFEWGLCTDIQPPDYETRMAILMKNVENCDREIDKEIIEYIATNIKSNIRELEGALNKILAFAKLNNVELTLQSAEEALRDVIYPDKPREITPSYIINVVCEHFNIKVEDIISKKRNAEFALPRQIAMYLCREMTDISLNEIGSFVGNRDHTTVMHGYQKITEDIKKSPELASKIDIIRKKISP